MEANQFFVENIAASNGTNEREMPKYPLVLRLLAHFFSFVFHPLFIPTYAVAFLLYEYPYAFAGVSDENKLRILMSVALNTAFFPAFVVFLLKQLKFISSITLRTQRDRIIPIIASMIFYFWAFYVAKNLVDIPEPMKEFLLCTFLGSIVALMANIKYKISLHGIAMGSMAVFFMILAYRTYSPMGIYVSIAVIVAGIVSTARMIVSDHNIFEVYLGLGSGALCMLVATAFV